MLQNSMKRIGEVYLIPLLKIVKTTQVKPITVKSCLKIILGQVSWLY
jgi:hypothetical protein